MEKSRSRGKFIQQMGISSDQIHYLYPEEVCYLLDVNAAEVEIDGQLVFNPAIIWCNNLWLEILY